MDQVRLMRLISVGFSGVDMLEGGSTRLSAMDARTSVGARAPATPCLVRHLGLLGELDHLARLARSVERVGQVQRGHSLSVVTAEAANAFSDYRDRNLHGDCVLQCRFETLADSSFGCSFSRMFAIVI